MPDKYQPDILDELETSIPPWVLKSEPAREKLREMVRIMLEGRLPPAEQ